MAYTRLQRDHKLHKYGGLQPRIQTIEVVVVVLLLLLLSFNVFVPQVTHPYCFLPSGLSKYFQMSIISQTSCTTHITKFWNKYICHVHPW